LIRDVIKDTISQLVFNRKEGARLLIDLPNYFPTGLFHRPGLPLKDIPLPSTTTRPKFKLEDILVDTIFSQLFCLPCPPEKEVYYAALLTEITKLAPQDIAPTLGRAIRWVYEHIEDISGELNMRFSTWFAIHLSNFGFTYKWEEWYPMMLFL
jgi:nuclear cap-binding protein subunit 1